MPRLKNPMKTVWLAALLATAAPSMAQVSQQIQQRRIEAYERLQSLVDAGNYQDALPLARTVVDLTETFDPLHEELPTAYNNLGVVQFRLGDVAAAEKSFTTALNMLERTESISSRRLISPLAGLGAVYAANGQPARAADALDRAIAISRRASGLFNLQQLDLVEALIEAYDQLGNLEGIDRERRYALQIVQQAYGADDPRTVPSMARLAEWYERMGQFAVARLYWDMAAQISSQEDEGRNEATINALIGIARTHRLQYVYDPTSLTLPPIIIDPTSGNVEPVDERQRVRRISYGVERAQGIKPDEVGERAALKAIEILDSTSQPPRALLVGALMELGDWYVTVHRPDHAISYYQRAWPLLSDSLAAGEPNPLLQPRPLTYVPPAAASRSRGSARGPVVSSPLEFSLTVTASGETADVTLVNDASENRALQIRRALGRARFSPRFENGQPVATEGYRFTEYWFELAPEDGPGELHVEDRPSELMQRASGAESRPERGAGS